jgi:hypothetical protein
MIEVNLLPGAVSRRQRSRGFTLFARTPEEEMDWKLFMSLAAGVGAFLGWLLHFITE